MRIGIPRTPSLLGRKSISMLYLKLRFLKVVKDGAEMIQVFFNVLEKTVI